MTAARTFALGFALASALVAGPAAAETSWTSSPELVWLDLGTPHWDLRGATVWDDAVGAGRWVARRAEPLEVRAAESLAAPIETAFEPRLQKIAFTATQPARTGKAGWYGADFDGRLTASGERFDMYRLTAASSELPLNSFVSVVNVKTGEAVTVRINDRRPAPDGALITLSLAAANRLNLDRTPDATVQVRYLGEAAPPAAGAMQVASR